MAGVILYSGLAIVLAMLVAFLMGFPRPRTISPQEIEAMGSTFDFVVVGGGTAGCLIASELARRSNFSVLLVEEGGPTLTSPLSFHSIPILVPFASILATVTGSPDFDYHLMPQTAEISGSFPPGNPERRVKSPRGRVLGGSGELNFMMHVRPTPGDYERWASLSGDVSWGYESMKHLEDQYERRGVDTEGVGVHLPYLSPVVQAFMEAGGLTRWGNSTHYNLDSHNRRGASRTEYSVFKGARHSTARAFLLPALKTQKNLHLLLHAKATKVLFEGNRAVEVQLALHGDTSRLISVRARKEIVVSAGAYASPQLLLLSGIGPKKELEKLGVDVVADIPAVGKHMQDHPMVPVKVRLGSEKGGWWPSTVTPLKIVGNPMNFFDYAFYGRGLLTSSLADISWCTNTSFKFVFDDSIGMDFHLINTRRHQTFK